MLRRVARAAGWIGSLFAGALAVLLALFLARLLLSRARLNGMRANPGLIAGVEVDRDAAGMPTIISRSRRDIA